jgi:hypothetical protein
MVKVERIVPTYFVGDGARVHNLDRLERTFKRPIRLRNMRNKNSAARYALEDIKSLFPSSTPGIVYACLDLAVCIQQSEIQTEVSLEVDGECYVSYSRKSVLLPIYLFLQLLRRLLQFSICQGD